MMGHDGGRDDLVVVDGHPHRLQKDDPAAPERPGSQRRAASCLPARHDWERKVTAHAELFTTLGDLTGDGDLARLVSSAAGRLEDLVMTVGPVADGIILSSHRRLLRELRAWDADGAAREVERHLGVLHFMGRMVACGADSGPLSRAS
jgi:hypothetical protein